MCFPYHTLGRNWFELSTEFPAPFFCFRGTTVEEVAWRSRDWFHRSDFNRLKHQRYSKISWGHVIFIHFWYLLLTDQFVVKKKKNWWLILKSQEAAEERHGHLCEGLNKKYQICISHIAKGDGLRWACTDFELGSNTCRNSEVIDKLCGIWKDEDFFSVVAACCWFWWPGLLRWKRTNYMVNSVWKR